MYTGIIAIVIDLSREYASVLGALPGKLNIKRHSLCFLYVHVFLKHALYFRNKY